MKFIHYLEKISGVDIFGLSSFLIFFLFFLVMAIWIFKADKATLKELSEIPLDNNPK
jgi:hypothetical protein